MAGKTYLGYAGNIRLVYPLNEYRRERFPPDLLKLTNKKTPAVHPVQPVFLYAHSVTNKTGGKDQKPMAFVRDGTPLF